MNPNPAPSRMNPATPPPMPAMPATPVPATPGAPWTSPASPLHLEQITAAKRANVKIRRAVGVAMFSGWTMAIFGGLSLLLSLGSQSVPGVLVSAGLCICSFIEIRNAGQLKQLNPLAPKRLAINQLAVGFILCAYALSQLWISMHTKSELMDALAGNPEYANIAELERPLTIALYLCVLGVGVLEPGLTALYYITRVKYVRDYIRATPQWILDLQRAGMSL